MSIEGRTTLDTGGLVKSITLYYCIQKKKLPPTSYEQENTVVYRYIVVQQVSQPADTHMNKPQEGSNSCNHPGQSRIINDHWNYLHFGQEQIPSGRVSVSFSKFTAEVWDYMEKYPLHVLQVKLRR